MNRFTRHLSALAAALVLAGCGSSSDVAISVAQDDDARASSNLEGVASTASTDESEEDIVGDIILGIESDEAQDLLALGTERAEPVDEEGHDLIGQIEEDLEIFSVTPDASSEQITERVKQGIEEAFESLARRQRLAEDENPALPGKLDGSMRIALLVPRSGINKRLGAELQRGAELALFSLRDPRIELLVFDSAADGDPARAARRAVRAGADIIIGPLFSDAVIKARAEARLAGIPMLALSNNSEIIERGSWLLGYVPEQQIDLLIGHAFAEGHSKIGIIVEPSPFGRRLADHAMSRLAQFDLEPEAVANLDAGQIVNDDELNEAIMEFTGYMPPEEEEEEELAEGVPENLLIREEELLFLFEDEEIAASEYGIETVEPLPEELPPPRFDAILFAGGADFAIRTAPVLAFFDAGPERVRYLGNSQWNQRRILLEPSLQGGIFTSRPTDNDEKFESLWSSAWQGKPGILARLSFDALATVAVLSEHDRRSWDEIISTGYKGFSGPYRLLPDGGNLRGFELRQVRQGDSRRIQSSPDEI